MYSNIEHVAYNIYFLHSEQIDHVIPPARHEHHWFARIHPYVKIQDTQHQAEVAGLSTIPKLCDKLYSSLPITPCRCQVFVDNKATLCDVKAPEEFMTTSHNFPPHSKYKDI